jgi:hypothetical protein
MKTDFSRFDYFTLDATALRKLPAWERPPTYRLQDTAGNGCYGDPPGYPTYFTQSVYTQNGNSPPWGTTLVIWFEGAYRVVGDIQMKDLPGPRHGKYGVEHSVNLHRLYKPLPESHPRVQAWISNQYRHAAHCYRDPGPYQVGPVKYCDEIVHPGGRIFPTFEEAQQFIESFDGWADIYGAVEKADYGKRPATLIYPVPDYKLKTFHDDPRFSAEWREKEQAATEQMNKEIEEKYAAACKPENHQAFLHIREFYPEHQVPVREVLNGLGQTVSMSYIELPPVDYTGDWWEREAVRPAPENCPGSYGQEHPMDGGWCQYCGQKPKEVKA